MCEVRYFAVGEQPVASERRSIGGYSRAKAARWTEKQLTGDADLVANAIAREIENDSATH